MGSAVFNQLRKFGSLFCPVNFLFPQPADSAGSALDHTPSTLPRGLVVME